RCDGGAGLLEPVRRAVGQAGFIASSTEPSAEAGGGEGLPVVSDEEGQVTGRTRVDDLGERGDNGLLRWRHALVARLAGHIAQRAALDMLPAERRHLPRAVHL